MLNHSLKLLFRTVSTAGRVRGDQTEYNYTESHEQLCISLQLTRFFDVFFKHFKEISVLPLFKITLIY